MTALDLLIERLGLGFLSGKLLVVGGFLLEETKHRASSDGQL